MEKLMELIYDNLHNYLIYLLLLSHHFLNFQDLY